MSEEDIGWTEPSDWEPVVGTCQDMCPKEEMAMRERQGLLHSFEIIPGSGRGKGRRPRCRPDRMVKEYSRPAAGKLDPKPEELRPEAVLVRVTDYLIDRIATRKDVPWSVVYEFVFDRLRAVRQDLVIQRISGTSAIYILERAVRFHIYSGYRLCSEPVSHVYDTKINDIHTQSCLKRLLLLYEEHSSCNFRMGEFSSLYVMYNFGHVEALQYVIQRMEKLKSCGEVKRTFDGSLSWVLGNYVHVFKIIQTLPPLLCCAVQAHLGLLHRHTLQVMSAGYSSKNLSFPLEKLANLLLLDGEEEASKLCRQHGLKVNNTHVNFLKSDFHCIKQIPLKHYQFIEKKLSNVDLRDLLHGHQMPT